MIVEGINVFQNPQNERLYITDFFDFSIYVDAAVDDIESWYLDRFLKMLSLAQNDPDSYYYRFTQMPIGGSGVLCPSGLDQYQSHKSTKLY